MNIGSESYKKYADAHAPKSRVVRDSLMAFLIGGLICAVAEALNHLWSALGMSSDDGGLLTSVVLIFTAAVLTAFGVFDDRKGRRRGHSRADHGICQFSSFRRR